MKSVILTGASDGLGQAHDEWMQPEEVAKLMLDLFELPKQIEISEITINRKKK